MKKSYLAVFHKAEVVAKKISLIFLIALCALNSAFGQLNQTDSYNHFSALKGPYDRFAEGGSLDAVPPVITYTLLTNTCTTGNRTLIATITDADGVPTSGTGLPKLYWSINNTGGNFAVTGVSLGSNQYSFSFGAAAIPGNIVYYYIVAQDNVGNVIAQPSAGAGGYSINPPAVSTDPTSPDFYVIQNTLAAGTYNVGVGQTYLTISDAVNAYNNSCLAGAVTFLLMDANYSTSEVFPISISNTQASAANTLTIKPNTGVNTIITGTSTDAIFKLIGADYVTIDGANAGGNTRNLTITNTNPSTGLFTAGIWVGSASVSNGATNNTIKNCIIKGEASSSTYAGIVSSSGSFMGTAAEAANVNNTYQNNDINTSYQGILLIGTAAGETGNVITTNKVGSASSISRIGYRGILISNQTNVSVNNNTVLGIYSSLGIGSEADPSGGIIVSGAISGGNIYSNKISDIKNTNIAGWHAYGITLQSTSAAAGMKIYNNFIYNIYGYGNAVNVTDNGHGIAIQKGGGYGIYYNSINLFTNQTAATGGISACIFIGTGVTGTASIDIRNNILSNRQTTGTRYAVYCSVPNLIFSSINYNDYYSSGQVGFLGSARVTIAAWQTATGSDGNSVIANPVFVSTTDLHLQPISPLNDQGISIAGITTDIDGTTRNAAPDIGAHEFTPPNCSNNAGGTISSDYIVVCSSGNVTLTSSGFSFGLGISYQWESSIDNTTFTAIAGETNPTLATPPTINVTTWYRLKVACTLYSGGTPNYSASIKITVYNPQILTTTPAARCGAGTLSLAATGTASTNLDWYSTATGGAPLFTGSPFTTPSIPATTTYYVASNFPGSNGTVGPVSPTVNGDSIETQLTPWQVYFNVTQVTTLLTVDIFPYVAGQSATIEVYNAAGTLLATIPYTTSVAGGNTAQTIPINTQLLIGNGYYLFGTLPTSGIARNQNGAVYPYGTPATTDIQITGNEFRQTYFMGFYKWKYSNGCSSQPRTAVTATIGASAPLTVTATPTSICLGSSSTLNATSSNSAYSYTWTPGALTGASVSVSPSTTTTYTVNATDGACASSGTVTVQVNNIPNTVTINPSPVTKCLNAPATLLTAGGGDISGINILSENFNGATTPTGWVTATTGSTGTVANSAWKLMPDGTNAATVIFHSNDNSGFYLSNSYANAGIARTTLRTPAFSLVGYTTAKINFWHNYAWFGDIPDSVCVEISQDLSSWTNLLSYKASKGSSTAFENVNISLNAYLGLATNYIRFRFTCKNGFYWAIDNVSITGGNSGTPITWTPITGLYTDAGAITAYTAGTASTTIYANPLVNTTYTATALSVNGCSKASTVDVVIKDISGVISGSTSVCPSGNATITVNLTGTGPWNLTYTDGTTPVTVNGIATSPYTFTVNPLVTTTYTLTGLTDAFCTAIPANLSGSAVVTVNPSVFSTWLGLSSDWMDGNNWCGGVPTNLKDVTIPGSLSFYPIITTGAAVAKNISIATGANISITATGTLSLSGTSANDGTITNNGTIILNGTVAQGFPGGATGTIAAMNILEVNKASGNTTFDRSFTITGTLKPTAGAIILDNDTVTLKSTVSGTARVDILGASASFSYNGTGKFSIERYISSATRTGWRFLAAPIGGTQTIKQAWQEGQASGVYTSTGYGMQIVGPGGTGIGFDIATSTPSLKTYKTATNTWETVIGGTLGPISTTQGYMAFIRGDRGSNTFGSMSATVLRMAGPIKTGAVSISTANANISTFISVGNPYPSAIDYSAASTVKTGLLDVYYLWDPKLGTYGGYQTFSGPGYVASPGGGSYPGTNKFIESGQAFFVISNGLNAVHSIAFGENSKVNSNVQVARPGILGKQLSTRLYVISGADANLYDGNRIDYDASYSNELDDNDAPKLGNFGENIGILSGGKQIAVERRAEIVNTDTIFYALGQLRQQQYQLEFTADNLNAPGLIAYLEDTYLQTTAEINLDGITTVDFTKDGNAGSYATGRFRIVFRQLRPVPVTITSILAYKQNKDIMVSWKVENELNIHHYDIEKSADGRNFIKIGTQAATGNGTATMQYNWLDKDAFTGDNYYRVRSVGNGNEVKYSSIVKVNMANMPGSIVVYPNPVTDGMIGVSLNNQPKGNYAIKLFSNNGQLILARTIIHPGGSQRVMLQTSSLIAGGVYSLEIILPSGKRRIEKVEVN